MAAERRAEVIKLDVSQRQHQAAGDLTETHRRLAEARRTSQGRLLNRVLAKGDGFRIEKVFYRAFRRAFGRSVGLRAPGAFVARLRHGAERTGGKVVEFSPAARRSRRSATAADGRRNRCRGDGTSAPAGSPRSGTSTVRTWPGSSRTRSPAKGTGAGAEAGEVVAAACGPAVRESPGKAVVLGPRTPER